MSEANSRPNDGQGQEDAPMPTEIVFHYIKSNLYRPIFVEVIFGGVTPRGLLQMSVFSEHFPIPQQSTYGVTDQGGIGGERHELRVSRGGIIRDVEATLLISPATAKTIIDWLQEKLRDVEKIEEAQKQRRAERKP